MAIGKYLDESEISRCLLCVDAPCTKACPQHAEIDKLLRSLFFENAAGVAGMMDTVDCTYCNAPCEKACVLQRKNMPVKIREIVMHAEKLPGLFPENKIDEVDLSTDICGVRLENPFLLSSSVVASSYDMCARAFDAGWAGVAFKTICNFPQHEASPRFSAIRNHANSFCGFKNIEQLSDHSVTENLDIFRRLRRNYPTKVIVASIMGQNEEEWAELARACEENGANVIECNFSCPNLEEDGLGVTIGQSEELVERFTRATKRGTKLPVLVKLTPNITDMVPLALAAKRGGADGIAAINTINSITGVNIETLVAEPAVQGKSIVGGYSGPAVKPIALRFISDLSNCRDLSGMHISGMGGIETWRDAVEFILLGAGSVQLTTSVMQYGYRIIEDLLSGLKNYMMIKGIKSIGRLVGGATGTVVDHHGLERGLVILPVLDKDQCIGCGRCYISCMDGGHQALTFDLETRRPKLDGGRCVGCHLCMLVCPSGAINPAKRAIRKDR